MKAAYIVSDFSYPPKEGLHQQTLLLVENLIKSGVDLHLFGFVKSCQALDVDALYADTGIRFRLPPSERPGSLLANSLRNLLLPPAYVRELRQVLEQETYNLIHAEGIAACTVPVKRQRSYSVLSFVDPGSRRNFRFFKAARKLKQKAIYLIVSILFFMLERVLRNGHPLWHVVSKDDCGYLSKIHRYRRVVSIPVSLPKELEVDFAPMARSSTKPVTILIYSDLRQKHMKDALGQLAEDVLRKLQPKHAVRYVVLGRLSRDREMTAWFQGLEVDFIGWADDYVALLRTSDIVILPDQLGTGLKNRAIQSMAVGAAVVGTPVAFEGIDVTSGRNALVASGPSGFRESINSLIQDANLRTQLGLNARAYALKEFGSSEVAELWMQSYKLKMLTPHSGEVTPESTP